MSSTWLPTLLTILTICALGSADGYQVALDSMESKNDKIVVCYVASWAGYRDSVGAFNINTLRPELCSHIVYAFAGLNINDWTIHSLDEWKDLQEGGKGNYNKTTELKHKYEGLKVTLAIGGYNQGTERFSLLAADPSRRKTFILSVVKFLKRFDFDGLDLDWEFPQAHDKENFVQLVKELREALPRKQYLLTAATTANPSMLAKGYDLVQLSKYLDYIHIMSYDYHGTWDRQILANAPLNATDGLSVVDTVSYFLKSDVPPEKIVLGLPMYGRTFVLVNELSPGESPMGQPCKPDGFPGKYTKENGFMGFNEICMERADDLTGWKVGWDNSSTTPYMVKGEQVVVFDNPESLAEKVKYSLEKGLAGCMVWSIDTDDFYGYSARLDNSSSGSSTPSDFPLMRSINNVLGRSISIGGEGTTSGTTKATTKKPRRKKNLATGFSVSLGLITLSMLVLSGF